jgi:hypothetical protein
VLQAAHERGFEQYGARLRYPEPRRAPMSSRIRSYVRQHHIAFLALFAALGGGGAYAASLGGGTVRGFAQNATNKSGDSSGTLAKLGGIALKYKSKQAIDQRVCTLSARTTDRGQLTAFYGVQSTEQPKDYAVRSKNLKAGGSAEVLFINFDPGAPGIERHAVGNLTWHDDKSNSVVTAVFHVAAEEGRCRFQGTLTGAG